MESRAGFFSWITSVLNIDVPQIPHNDSMKDGFDGNSLTQMYMILVCFGLTIFRRNQSCTTSYSENMIFETFPGLAHAPLKRPRVSRSAGGVSASGWRPRHPPGKSDPCLDPNPISEVRKIQSLSNRAR